MRRIWKGKREEGGREEEKGRARKWKNVYRPFVVI